MRTTICLMTAALVGLTACSDNDPFSSTTSPGEEELASPAAKLTVSRTPAGGYRPGMQKLTGIAHGSNAATSDGPAQGCPAGWTPRDMVFEGELTVLGPYTSEQSHCAAPDRLSFKNGEFVIVTEPGDELHGSYNGTVAILGAPGLEARQLIRITGGTGRFANASGYIYNYGSLIPGEGEGGNAIDGLSDGWIQIPGSQPFQGNFVGGITDDENPESVARCAGDLARILDLSGEANLLGDYTATGRHCFVLADIINFQPGGSIRFVKGVAAFTTDGEELRVNYKGVFHPISLSPPEGPLTMTMTFSGGTGRFAGATGELTSRAYSSPGENGTTGSFSGALATFASK